MIKSTIRVPLLGFVLWCVASGSLQGQDSYVGVYAFPLRTTSVDGEFVGFTTQDTLRFDVRVANEEGEQELYFAEGLAGGLRGELFRNGTQISSDQMRIEWSALTRRYAFLGDLPEEPAVPGVIEPGVGMQRELELTQRDGSRFPAGTYELHLTVIPNMLRRSEGSPWVGRGGLGGARFRLYDVVSPEDKKREMLIVAMDLLVRSQYQDALTQYAKLVEEYPEDIDGWTGFGVASFHLGRHEDAAVSMEKAMPRIISEGLHSGVPGLLAESYVVLGDREKAIETLQEILAGDAVDLAIGALEAKVARDGGR